MTANLEIEDSSCLYIATHYVSSQCTDARAQSLPLYILFGYSPFHGVWRGLGGIRGDFDLLGIKTPSIPLDWFATEQGLNKIIICHHPNFVWPWIPDIIIDNLDLKKSIAIKRWQKKGITHKSSSLPSWLFYIIIFLRKFYIIIYKRKLLCKQMTIEIMNWRTQQWKWQLLNPGW